jgi:hypothetical protein
MAKPKDGKVIPPKDPKAPKDALEAITTDPGNQSQIEERNREVKKTSLDSVKVKPEPPTSESGEETPVKLSWISVELQDNDGKPVPNQMFKVTFSDNTTSDGVTGENGKCKIDGATPGSAKIEFYTLDKREWKPK